MFSRILLQPPHSANNIIFVCLHTKPLVRTSLSPDKNPQSSLLRWKRDLKEETEDYSVSPLSLSLTTTPYVPLFFHASENALEKIVSIIPSSREHTHTWPPLFSGITSTLARAVEKSQVDTARSLPRSIHTDVGMRRKFGEEKSLRRIARERARARSYKPHEQGI